MKRFAFVLAVSCAGPNNCDHHAARRVVDGDPVRALERQRAELHAPRT